MSAFRGRSFISVTELTLRDVELLFQVADWCSSQLSNDCDESRAKLSTILSGFLMTTIFFEPSTRTSSSFQAAMLRLGGKVISINDVSSSSVAKGETLEDTMHCLAAYSDIVVCRHHTAGSAERAATALASPSARACAVSSSRGCLLVNAGDGVGEHPTQALLDLYTVWTQRRRSHSNIVDGLTGLQWTLCGDLKNGRTVHSLCKLLVHFRPQMNWVSPGWFQFALVMAY